MNVIKKISKIKNKKELKSIPINKPIWNDNYLHHYLAYYSKLDIFLWLDKEQIPISKKDNNGDSIFHILAKNGDINFLKKIIELFPNDIYLTDKNNSVFLTYIINDLESIKKILGCLEKINPKWEYIFQNYDYNNITPLLSAINDNNYTIIKFLFNKKYILLDEKKHNLSTPLHYIINKEMKEKQIIELLKIASKRLKLKDIIDYNGYNLVFPAIHSNFLKVIKYLQKEKVDLDYIAPITSHQPFRLSYSLAIQTNDYSIPKYIWESGQVKPDKINWVAENLAHFLIGTRLKTGKGSWELEKDILPQVKNWNLPNIDKATPFHYLVQLKDLKKYIKILPKSLLIDHKIKNKYEQKIGDIIKKKELKLLNKFKKYNSEEKDILIKPDKSVDVNIYHSYLHDISIYFIISIFF